MGLLGISLLLASVVYVIVRPPPWLPPPMLRWRVLLGLNLLDAPAKARDGKRPPDEADGCDAAKESQREVGPEIRAGPDSPRNATGQVTPSPSGTRTPALVVDDTRAPAVQSTPPPPTLQASPTLVEPKDEQTTPKAAASDPPSIPVPSFTLSNDRPTAAPRPPSVMAPPPVPTPKATSSSMMPPPLPPYAAGRAPSSPSSARVPSLAQFPAPNSAQRARGPVPNRGPSLAPPSSGLAPPPTHSSKPSKPNRKVLLSPGHSPLDWARISGPNSDLRGVDPSTPYLRVTPSMLKKMTGRKGKDGWMALNGKVYNVTPYADFHPGGVPELMRGAGRDGTKLFGEVHPWVNYETMLSSCLVGLLVEESDEGKESEMERMD